MFYSHDYLFCLIYTIDYDLNLLNSYCLLYHHLINMKIILQLLPFDPLAQNVRNQQALSCDWNELKTLKLLENCVASSINIEGSVFHPENRFQIRLPSVEVLPQSEGKDQQWECSLEVLVNAVSVRSIMGIILVHVQKRDLTANT